MICQQDIDAVKAVLEHLQKLCPDLPPDACNRFVRAFEALKAEQEYRFMTDGI